MEGTKEQIAAAFRALLNERTLNKITVRDIVERCGLHRGTFYHYFQSIPDLIQQIMEEEAGRLLQSRAGPGAPVDSLRALIQYGLDHKRAILHVYRGIRREDFQRLLERTASHLADEYLNAALADRGLSAEDRDVLGRYYKSAVMGVLLNWLEDGMRYDLMRAAELLCGLMGVRS